MADREAFITNVDILHNPTSYRRVTIKDSSRSGYVYAVKKSNGKTISIQPDGREEERDGDGGRYEQARFVGDARLTYAYDDSNIPVEFRVILL